MKKALCLLFILSIFAPKAFAAQTGKLGFGIAAGQPFGPTLEYWFDEKGAIDLGIGFNHDGFIYGDYLWHGWELTPRQEAGKVGLYTGLGARIENVKHNDDKYAARVPLGINFIFNQVPLELFGEVVPVLQFAPDGDLNLDAAVGARYYFAGIR